MHFWYLRILTLTNVETREVEKFEKVPSLQAEDELGSRIELIAETVLIGHSVQFISLYYGSDPQTPMSQTKK
jgi:hypothetical protein